MDFTKLKNKKTTKKAPAPKKVYKEVVEAETPETQLVPPKAAEKPAEVRKPPPAAKKRREPKKVGRKSWKQEGVDYVRIGLDVPKEMKLQLKNLLFNKFAGKYISQDEMLNAALEQFIKKHAK